MKRIAPLLAVLLLLFGCNGNDTTVQLIETNINEVVPLGGNLEFVFDQPLVPDSVTNRWDTTEYIAFNPPIPGRYKWRTPTELVFSPFNFLQPATDYVAELTSTLLDYADRLALGKSDDIAFHTSYLELEGTRAWWGMTANATTPAINYTLNFNYGVRASEVAELLEIEIGGEKKTFVAPDAGEVSKEITLSVVGVEPKDLVLETHISLRKGLVPLGGSVPLNIDVSTTMDIPSPYNLSIFDLEAEHDGVNGTVRVSASQGVVENDLKDYIIVEPHVAFQVTSDARSFTIISEDFDIEKKYAITIRKGLPGKIGGLLKFEYSQEVSFGELDPSIGFVNSNGLYLGANGHRNMEIGIVNVPRVNLTVTKVYANNLQQFLNSSRYDDFYNPDTGDWEYTYGYDYNQAGRLGDVVHNEELAAKDMPRNGRNRLLKLDFHDKIGAFPGLYIVDVQSTEKSWLRSRKVVAISDLGVIAKKGASSLFVYVNSLKTAEPVGGVELQFIGRNNQVAGTATTDANGVATFDHSNAPANGFAVQMITAKKEGDFNFLSFGNTTVKTGRFDVGGLRENAAGYDAFLYGDRDIYRPGETMHIAGIVRDRVWENPGRLPVKLRIFTPSGQTFKTLRKTLNSEGSFEADVELPVAAMTGPWSAQLVTSTDVALSSYRIMVEEFVPDRIRVNYELSAEEAAPGDELLMTLEAQNFFGPPAANRTWQVESQILRKHFHSSDHSGYNYSIANRPESYNLFVNEGETDEEGKATVALEISSGLADQGLLEAKHFITVFDETGRPVNNVVRVPIVTQDVFYGIGRGDYYNKVNRPVKVPLIALDPKGKLLNSVEVQVQLIRWDYRTVLARSGSYYRYRSEREEKLVETKIVKLSGSGNHYQFTPELSGEYEVRVTRVGGSSYVSNTYYCYGWGSTSYSSFKVDNEGRVDITLDKKEYEVGDRANVLLKTPFAGKVLVTVESNEVLQHFYLDTDKRAASFEMDITDELLPNVYISATCFRAHEVSDLPLTVAHGFEPLRVEKRSHMLPVEIAAATESRSHRTQKITVSTEPGAMVSIAAVDEGILQLTGFQTPDPYGFYFQKRALEVSSYDVYASLYPEVEMRSGYLGGDGMEFDRRVNPMKNERVKLVAFWSGMRKADNKGKVEWEIDIPQFSGDLRIMAVAHKADAFGNNQHNMIVADPLVVSTALPRFLSPKDTVEVPVILTNTTAQSTTCKARIEVEGPIEILGSAKQSVKLEGKREGEVRFRLAVPQELGAAKVTVTAAALGEDFVSITDLPVRPSSPLQKENGSGRIAASSTETLQLGTDRFLPGSTRQKLVLSRSPALELAPQLEYLVGYPHGCVEQTTSKAFPQLYFADMAEDLLNDTKMSASAGKNVQAAINKLSMMQSYNGGLSYWPGGNGVHWWGSVYACHFLTEAKKAGYDVRDGVLNKLCAFIKKQGREKQTRDYYYNGGKVRSIAPREALYALFVLAANDKADMSMMNYYKSRPDLLTIDSRYMLAAAYALTGDRTKYQQVLPGAFEGEVADRMHGGSFSSHLRNQALALNLLLEVDPQNPQIASLSTEVADRLKDQRYINTQERVFSFLALGKLARQDAGTSATAEVKSGSKTLGAFTGKTLTLHHEKLAGKPVDIAVKGSGRLYYFWQAEGIDAKGDYVQEDSKLQVRRQFFDRYGNMVNSNTFKQNDLVVVRLSLRSSGSRFVENVAITDILPAGFEIENPRLSEVPGMGWVSNETHPDHLDIRDDRIHLFTSATNSNRYYYYSVRAVSPGQFQMGPAAADAMYDGSYHSYHGAGIITVEEK